MSRAERRAYKRMTKNQDPYALPAGAGAARGRAAARTRPRRPQPAGEFEFITGRFLAWLIGGALLAGLLGFSIAWPNGLPLALYVGLAAGVGWLLLAAGFRLLQRRMAEQQIQR